MEVVLEIGWEGGIPGNSRDVMSSRLVFMYHLLKGLREHLTRYLVIMFSVELVIHIFPEKMNILS